MIKHKHLIVRAECSNPPRYEQNILDWSSNLIRDIGMKIMMGPYAKYCHMEANSPKTQVPLWQKIISPRLQTMDIFFRGSHPSSP